MTEPASETNDGKIRTQLNRLMDWARDFRTSRLLTTAVEEEILERFTGGASVEDARRSEEDPDAVFRFTRALASLGLLDRTGKTQFRPAELTETFLLPSSEFDLRPILKLFHRNYDLWAKLPESLRKGHDVENDAFGDVEFGRDFMLAMETRAHFAKTDVAKALEPIVETDDSIIDLGGGTGVFIREILRRYPSTEAALADLPHVVETAREFSGDSPVIDRLSFRELEFFEDESYGEGFDVALLFSICHMFNRDKNRTLLGRTADALNPGGRIIVRDYVLEDEDVGTLEDNLFDLHMLLATDTGCNYTLSEFRDLFEEAGLRYDRTLNVPGPDDLLVAEKPT